MGKIYIDRNQKTKRGLCDTYFRTEPRNYRDCNSRLWSSTNYRIMDYNFHVSKFVYVKLFLKSFVLWDITHFSPLKVNRPTRGKFRLHFQSRRKSQAIKQHKAGDKLLWFLVGVIFGPKNGDDIFLRNVGSRTYYTVLHCRRWKHLFLINFCFPTL
jgi:hypothetical protein